LSSRPGIHEDLHASDVRERQLWLLTYGLLLLLALATIVGSFVVLDDYLVDTSGKTLIFRLLGGLGLLIVLFSAYVLEARLGIERVKLFLNQLSGMATGNLDVKTCLIALAEGMAKIYRAPLCRILIQRTTDSALEVVSTYQKVGEGPEPETPLCYEFKHLGLLRRVLDGNRPVLLNLAKLDSRAVGAKDREVLTAGLTELGRVLVMPLQTAHGKTGFIVVGFKRGFGVARPGRRLVSNAEALARHAGTVLDEAIRRREAIRDPLTDLYNRRHFKRCIREEIARADRERHGLAVLLCDLDGFKNINDSRGHQFGDVVLKAVATSLRQATRGTDLHFRWGGDEMVVVLSNSTEEGALIAAERIRAGVRGYAAENDMELDMSVGIAIYPNHGTCDEELIRVADLAMYVAKKTGDKMRVGFEEYTVNEESVNFVYQPIWHVDSDKVVGHEVFTRDPGGVLSPVELFQRYRAVGQLRRLKRLIFDLQVRRAQEAGVQRLFLNADLEFLHGVEPPAVPEGLEVVLELSELDSNTSEDNRVAIAFRWRRAGYRIALDDFGAGYASLPILATLKPDYIKVDRTCIVRAAKSNKYRDFLRHLLRGAAEFTTEGLVAEGIEQPTELQVARELGIVHAQGFLLGRPAPTAEVVKPVESLESV